MHPVHPALRGGYDRVYTHLSRTSAIHLLQLTLSLTGHGLSKSAADHMARIWAAELHDTGVTVASIDPVMGGVDR